MSENMNDTVEVVVNDAEVITVPIDDTLSNSGEAADAAAVGAALALKADASSVVTISVDGQEADNQGVILLYGTHIPMSGTDDTTLQEAVADLQAMTAADIPMSSDPQAESVADAVGAIQGLTAETIPMNSEQDADTIAEAIADAVTTCTSKTANDIQMSSTDTTKVKDRIEALETATDGVVKSVNNETPDENGNVALNRVPYADNLLSSGSQSSEAEFIIRASGGDASIGDGDARISSIRGNAVHTGFTPETLTVEANGDSITATIDRAVFIAEVSSSTVITLTYTTSWSTDPSTYGVTVNGTPTNGDTIKITYVKEVRGEIMPANPQTFVATGWNLYNRTAGYARVVKYSETYGYRVGGSFTAITWQETPEGDATTITVTNRGFQIPDDGYIYVTGADATTEIYMTWGDWTSQANGGVHENYTQNVINLAGIMAGSFPNGLLAVGDVYDEISFSDRKAYSRIEVLEYSEEARQEAEESGRAYDFDEDFIYWARESAIETALSEDMGKFTVNGHGIEMFTGTEIAPEVHIVYSNDLKNKLERDVLTISQQSLKNAQKAQVRSNIGAVSMSDLSGMFMLKSYSYNYSIEANGTLTITTTQLGISNPEGYTLIGLVGFNARSQYVNVTRVYPGMESMVFLVNSRAAVTAQTFTIRLLFAKSSLVS